MLYEIKLKIKPEEQQEIIERLNLVFVKEYSDTDKFIKIDSKNKKYEKVKEVDGQFKHYKLFFDGQMFVIQGKKINKFSGQLIKTIKRTKKVFKWPALDMEVAFDFLWGYDDDLFFEVYDRNKNKIKIAYNKLKLLGYEKFFGKAYAEL